MTGEFSCRINGINDSQRQPAKLVQFVGMLSTGTEMIRHVLLLLTIFFVVSCGSEESEDVNKTPPDDEKPVILGSAQIGEYSTYFYLNFAADSAILGFSVENDSSQKRYCPMYASTYRGIPAIVLEVFVSDSQEEMWVHSSWPGYEMLGYHRMGTGQCITRYGENALLEKSMPESLSGGAGRFPEMNTNHVSKRVTFRYDDEDPDSAKYQ